jgi:hypothetical protein
VRRLLSSKDWVRALRSDLNLATRIQWVRVPAHEQAQAPCPRERGLENRESELEQRRLSTMLDNAPRSPTMRDLENTSSKTLSP